MEKETADMSGKDAGNTILSEVLTSCQSAVDSGWTIIYIT